MKKSFIFIIILSLAFTLFIGCTNVSSEQQVRPVVAPTIQEETDTIPAESHGHWITIDPLSNISAGKVFIITGKTNLNVSEGILVQVIPEWWSDVRKRSQCAGREIAGQAAFGTIHPVSGNDSTNTWNFSLDLSTLPSQKYILSVNAINQTASARVNFTLSGNIPAPVNRSCT